MRFIPFRRRSQTNRLPVLYTPGATLKSTEAHRDRREQESPGSYLRFLVKEDQVVSEIELFLPEPYQNHVDTNNVYKVHP